MIMVDYIFCCDVQGCGDSIITEHNLDQPQRPPEICLPRGWVSLEDGLHCPKHKVEDLANSQDGTLKRLA